MNQFVEGMMGMDKMNDQMIASDLLISSKSGIKNTARALTEATSPQVRATLKKQLDDAVNFHEKVSSYMINKGWYKAYDVNQQIQMDIKNAQMVMNLES